MDLPTRKIEFIQEFLKVQNEDIIVRLEKLLKKETARIEYETTEDEKEVGPSFSLDEYKNRIKQSMLDSKDNKTTENKDLLVEIRKWH